MSIMAWCLRRVGVLVASVRNLAFLVLPKHALAGRQQTGRRCLLSDARLTDSTRRGSQAGQAGHRQGGMDLAIGHSIDLLRSTVIGRHGESSPCKLLHLCSVDASRLVPVPNKVSIKRELGDDGPCECECRRVVWVPEREAVKIKSAILPLWAHVTRVTLSMTNKRQDAYASWACRGSHTLLVAANVGKNGTGDCARDSDWQEKGSKEVSMMPFRSLRERGNQAHDHSQRQKHSFTHVHCTPQTADCKP